MSLGYDLVGPYGRGRGGPGGWWLMSDVDLELERHEVYRPDLLGYRKDRVPDFPRERPLRLRPDWVCEVLSPSNARYDLGHKRGVYHRAGVPWYWIVDPVHRTIVACAWHEKGYLIAEGQEGEGNLRLPPFPEAELDLDAIFPPPAG
ncbi:Uma2 family endonuclease [Myxococcota bacterium]|nr:Uma2 family endonuclease [Myxococcota bacterium]